VRQATCKRKIFLKFSTYDMYSVHAIQIQTYTHTYTLNSLRNSGYNAIGSKSFEAGTSCAEQSISAGKNDVDVTVKKGEAIAARGRGDP
jgi:hypothetical protein